MALDYSGQHLRGRSFRGQNLEGANFSSADIRGANFTAANLKGANFSHAKAGLQKRWAIFLVLISWMLMGLSGFLSAFAGVWGAFLVFSTDKNYPIVYQIAGWTILVILVIFFVVTICQGIQGSLKAVAIPIVFAVVFAVAVAFVGSLAKAFAFATSVAIAGAIAGAVAVAVAFAVTLSFAFATSVAIAGAIAGAIAVVVAFAVTLSFVVAIAGAIANAVPLAFTLAIAITLFSIYISWRALEGDLKHILIRDIAVAFAAIGGTSFRNADLIDANFKSAILKSTDFRKANLTRTYFYKTEKLDCVRPGSTYLQKAEIRHVLITGVGQNKNFTRFDLRGINLSGCQLLDSSFIGADLSEANLQDADLSRAKLVQTQLDSTDFTGATLTGAYIEDWGITNSTLFNGVQCKYVYMRLPTIEDPGASHFLFSEQRLIH
jgi:uncharacterized protein YjbI with pentapeptide repeats